MNPELYFHPREREGGKGGGRGKGGGEDERLGKKMRTGG